MALERRSLPGAGPKNSSALGTQPLNQLYFQDGMIKRVREPDASEDGSFGHDPEIPLSQHVSCTKTACSLLNSLHNEASLHLIL